MDTETLQVGYSPQGRKQSDMIVVFQYTHGWYKLSTATTQMPEQGKDIGQFQTQKTQVCGGG